MNLTLVTGPVLEPVTLAEAKLQCQVDGAEFDTFFPARIAAARVYLERTRNIAMLTQVWDLHLDAWPQGDRIRVPRPPLQAAVLSFRDSAEAVNVVDPAMYRVGVESAPGEIVLGYSRTWPSAVLSPSAPIAVRFTCGYATAAAVPENWRQAVLLLVGHYFRHREAVVLGDPRAMESTALAMGVDSLMNGDRVYQ